MRSWLVMLLAAGLSQAQEAAPQVPVAQAVEAPKGLDQLRPTQRKFQYFLWRAAVAGHELAYFQSHPKAPEVKAALEALVAGKAGLDAKKGAALPAVEAYLAKVYEAHGLYAEGAKFKLESSWKDLAAAARTVGGKALEARFARLKGLLLDPKVDAVAPSWAEPEAPKGKKGRKPKAPAAPEGFRAQKGMVIAWLKKALPYVENVRAEVEVNGEKKQRSVANPELAKPLAELIAALDGEDLALLRNPGLAHFDLRRLVSPEDAASGRLGQGLLAAAPKIASAAAPEGPTGPWRLMPVLETVPADSKFAKGEKRIVLGDVRLAAAPADMAAQMAAVAAIGSRDSL